MTNNEKKANIKQLFINLTERWKKVNSLNLGYDIPNQTNIIFKKVMLTEQENNFMLEYLGDDKDE